MRVPPDLAHAGVVDLTNFRRRNPRRATVSLVHPQDADALSTRRSNNDPTVTAGQSVEFCLYQPTMLVDPATITRPVYLVGLRGVNTCGFPYGHELLKRGYADR